MINTLKMKQIKFYSEPKFLLMRIDVMAHLYASIKTVKKRKFHCQRSRKFYYPRILKACLENS